MKKLLIVIIASIAMFGSMHASSDNDPQNIMIHLSNYTNDLHSVTMALKIGHMLASHGEEVTMFVDLEGVRLVDKHQPVDLTWGSGKTIKEVLQEDLGAEQYVRWLTEFPDGDQFTIPSIGENTVRDYTENNAAVYDALDTGEFTFQITP